MFRAIKQSYELEVSFDGNNVRIKPAKKGKERTLIERTLARCEEFLAQVSVQEQTATRGLHLLVRHFKNRGWQIVF